ncbi:MAG: phosphatidate cytidylyltransferase [Gammaproteobacteria bacterium]|nr:phosphatidate cytidylyltransferase [Gammaproteobacteria bacterium]
MFRTRVVTGTVLAGLVLALLYGLPVTLQLAVIALVTALGGYEWGRLAGLGEARCQIFAALVLIACVVLYRYRITYIHPLLLASLGLWLLHAFSVLTYPKRYLTPFLVLPGNLLVGLLMLVAASSGLASLLSQNRGPEQILVLLLTVIATDTGAYLTGRRWGRRKLVPALSPGKTWVGLYGGITAGTLTAPLASELLGVSQGYLPALLIGVVVALFSVIGDLTESLYKRSAGVKDSGRLLPGHGGILDRIDSLLAATPVYALSVMCQQTSLLK